MINLDKRLFINDIDTLVRRIKKFKVDTHIEINTLTDLKSNLQYSKDFNVTFDNLAFNIKKKVSGTIPPDVKAYSIYCTHNCLFDTSINQNESDHISSYALQIDITGYGESSKEYNFSWHLDKNIVKEGDNIPKFTHPYYHFQAGGNELENKDSGELLLLGAPRIPHPPMDIFLTFHFIINNFFSSKDYTFVKELLEDYDYQQIIVRAQNRMWEPYFNGYNKDSKHGDFNRNNVFPLFIDS